MSFDSYHKLLSPCRSECNLEGGDNEYCSSCLRTIDEIRNWRRLSEEECLMVLARINARKSH